MTHWEDALSLVLAGKGVTSVAAAGAQYYSRLRLVFKPFTKRPGHRLRLRLAHRP